jgi:hypothetical protein
MRVSNLLVVIHLVHSIHLLQLNNAPSPWADNSTSWRLQEHFFAVPEPGKLAAKINWRINRPNGDFIERSTIQVCRACELASCCVLTAAAAATKDRRRLCVAFS